MELYNELSSELLEIVAGLSLPVKIAWPVFAGWAIAQAVWYRRARTVPPVLPRSAPAPIRRPRPPSAVKAPISAPRAGSPDFIAALAGENDERAAALRATDLDTMADASSARSVYR